MNLRRLLALLATTLAILAAPLRAQEPETPPEEDPADRITRRIEQAVDEEIQRLRVELRALIRRELGVTEESLEERIQRALDAVEADWMRQVLSHLASDELAGRRAGSDGERAACEFIAGKFREFGLTPVGDADETGARTYFQNFTMGRVRSRNCVGLLEGSDAALRDQIVIIGGHHDHLGRGRSFGALEGPQEGDDIYNGADDNASGTTTVLAIARAFHESGLRPRRSILFMTFGAEEMGLVGSRHYVEHPLFPLENTVAMINLDMVGRNGGQRVGLYGVGTADSFREIAEAAVAATGLHARLADGTSIGFGDSDHSSFVAAGVPAMFFFTGLHRQYHRVTDHADLIEFDHMARIGRTAFLILWDLATRDARPQPRIERRTPRPPDIAPPPRRVLGITTSQPSASRLDAAGLGEHEGAVAVETVQANTPAAAAGLREGDWIVSFNGRTLPRDNPLGALRDAIQEAPTGQDVPVEIIRDGQRLRLNVRWER